MYLIVLAIVSIAAFAATRLSMNLVFKSLDSVKSNKAKKTIKLAALIIAPILCLIVYFYPVDYGSPRNLTIWIMVWSTKTILYFLSPALVAVLVAMYYKEP